MWGKFFGSMLGFAAGGPVGAVMGQAWGSQWDKLIDLWLTGQLPGMDFRIEGNRTGADDAGTIPAIFRILGCLTAMDSQHAGFYPNLQPLIRQLQLGPNAAKNANTAFQQGLTDAGLDPVALRKLSQLVFWAPQDAIALLGIAIQVCSPNGPPNPQQMQALHLLRENLGLPVTAFKRLLDQVTEFQSRQAASETALSKQQAGKILKVNPAASFEQVKLQYRRLMKQHHPDKLIAQRASPDAIAKAVAKAQEIQRAFEVFKRQAVKEPIT